MKYAVLIVITLLNCNLVQAQKQMPGIFDELDKALNIEISQPETFNKKEFTFAQKDKSNSKSSIRLNVSVDYAAEVETKLAIDDQEIGDLKSNLYDPMISKADSSKFPSLPELVKTEKVEELSLETRVGSINVFFGDPA